MDICPAEAANVEVICKNNARRDAVGLYYALFLWMIFPGEEAHIGVHYRQRR